MAKVFTEAEMKAIMAKTVTATVKGVQEFMEETQVIINSKGKPILDAKMTTKPESPSLMTFVNKHLYPNLHNGESSKKA